MGEAIGAFMISALLITLAGITGWFERVMNRIPMEIAAALLAGVLARFGCELPGAMLQLLPQQHDTDGFFAAVLERRR